MYNTTRVLNPDFTFNEAAYKQYSPLLLGPAFSLSYGMGFAGLISTIVHVTVFYGPDIVNRTRSARYEEADVHLKMMRKYREAPEWWFLIIFAISFAFGMAASQHWQTHLPWWAYIIAILLGAALVLPVGMTMITSSVQNIILLIASRCRSGYYESTDWSQHYYRDDSWLHVSFGSVKMIPCQHLLMLAAGFLAVLLL